MTKILKDNEIDKIEKNKLVLAGGCFDVIHQAHIEFLEKSKSEGKILVLLLESDENIKRIKGNDRPLNNQLVRAENLSKLNIVDYIILLNMPDSSHYYYNLVKSIHPDIIAVTSNDSLLEIKKEQAEMVGGRVVVVMDRDENYSTTKMIEKT